MPSALLLKIVNAWGEILSATGDMADINPLRYRGYYFDSDTGLYYLKARYYAPQLCRFINADGADTLGVNGDIASYNLFAYCGNNPISRTDEGGFFWNFVVGAVAGAVVGAATTIADIWTSEGFHSLRSSKSLAKIAISAVCGAVNGVVAASGAYFLVGSAVSTATSFVESVSHELIDNSGKMSSDSWREVATDTASGFVGGIVGGNGVIRSDKNMMNRVTRFIKHVPTDGIQKACTFFYKMSATYSKKFTLPVMWGIGKGWLGTQGANQAFLRLGF